MFVLSNGAVFANMKRAPDVIESTRPADWFNPHEFHTFGTWITAYLETRLRLFYFGLDRDLLALPDPRRQREVLAAQWASLDEAAQHQMIESAVASGQRPQEPRIVQVIAGLRINRRAGAGEGGMLLKTKVAVLEAYRRKDPRKFAYYMLTCPFKDCVKPDFYLINSIVLSLRKACLDVLPKEVSQPVKRRKGKQASSDLEHPYTLPEAALLLLEASTMREGACGSEDESMVPLPVEGKQSFVRETKAFPPVGLEVLTFLSAKLEGDRLLVSAGCSAINKTEDLLPRTNRRKKQKHRANLDDVASTTAVKSPDQSSNCTTRNGSVARSFLEPGHLPGHEGKHLLLPTKKERKFRKGKPAKPKHPLSVGVKLSSLHRGSSAQGVAPSQPEAKKQKMLAEGRADFSAKEEVDSRQRPCSSVSTIDVIPSQSKTSLRKKVKGRRKEDGTAPKTPEVASSSRRRSFSAATLSLTRASTPAADVCRRINELFEESLTAQIDQSVEQLVQLSQLLDPAREIVKARITAIVLRTFHDEVDLVEFGSYSTRLTTPLSDIDIGLRHRTLHLFSHAVVSEMLECLAENLAGIQFITSVTTILTASVPVIKIEADPSIPFEGLPTASSLHCIKCDIIVLAEEGFGVDHSSIRTTHYIRDAIERYPTFHSNVLLLKYCLNCLDATNAYKGGLNSYGLSLLYIAFLRSENMSEETRLGRAFLRFLAFVAAFDPDRSAVFLNNPSNPVIVKEFYMGVEIGQLLVMDPTSLVPRNVTGSCLLFRVIAEFFKAASRELESIRAQLLEEFGQRDLSYQELSLTEESVRVRAKEKLTLQGEPPVPLLHALFCLKL